MRIFFKSFIILHLLLSIVYAENTKDTPTKTDIKITELKTQLLDIEYTIENSIWIKRYNSYLTYRQIEKDLIKIKKDEKKYSRWKGSKYKELSYQLKNKIKIKENELSLISEYKDSPIGRLIKPKDIEKAPDVTNPIKIIEAYSYMQKLNNNVQEYTATSMELGELLGTITLQIEGYKEIYKLTKDKNIKIKLTKLKKEFKDFVMVVDIVSTTLEVYSKKIEQVIEETKGNITNEIEHIIKLSIILAILFLLTVVAKTAMKKYIEDDDKYYTTNKLINFFFIVVSIFILLFSYMDNASYLVTFLGFASAGIAIALKDWFMSMFGWIAIMTSGSINPGDRIKVQRDGIEVVGDVLDITLLKIAIREDTTLTSYTKNRRTGRVFFIPNNYIFTDMISNYTFDGLRTVWDVVDLNITFDSNHKRAVQLAKEITTQHARPYTDLAKKRLHKMRKKYVLRNSNPEPRIFAFAETYGIVISSWFHTNSHATLGLKSTISMAILDAFNSADDIHIAYPTQTLRVKGEVPPSSPEALLPGTTAHGLFDGPATV